ncbi:WD40-repeat-containing domain protein, partial [Baffinella frigidus]
TSKLAGTFEVGGCALTVAFASGVEDNLFWAATSQGHCHLIDKRMSGSAAVLVNDCMVNTLVADASGEGEGGRLLTGDTRGLVKCWDVRVLSSRTDGGMQACEVLMRNADAGKPISHLAVSAPGSAGSGGGSGGDDHSVLAANCYDDVIRVYDRSTEAAATDAAPGPEAPRAPAEALRLTHSLYGHKNKNLPIRSSIFRGAKYSARMAAAEGQRSLGRDAARNRGSGAEQQGDENSYMADSGPKIDRSLLLATGSADTACYGGGGRSLLLATGSADKPLTEPGPVAVSGSADKACYVFDVAPGQVGALVQRLDGHSDRVYATSWHPSEPVLATASGDFTIKLWSCK